MEQAVKDGVFKSKFLKNSLAEGDAVAMEAVDRACHYLAVATGNLINTINEPYADEPMIPLGTQFGNETYDIDEVNG